MGQTAGKLYTISGLGQLPTNLWRYIRTSPGRIFLVGVALMTILAISGGLLYQLATERDSRLDTMISQSGPMADSAQQLYVSLSVADSSAVTSYLSGGIESPQSRDQYRAAIHKASLAATDAANGLDAVADPEAMEALRTINTTLPVYTGIIETARANNRAGHPVSAAYVAEASALMQETILPAAAFLYDSTVTDLRNQQEELRRPKITPIILAALAVLALIIAQLWLRRRTNRRFNLGLFLSTALMVIALVGGGAGMITYINSSALSAARGSDPMHNLVNARILAQQTRAQETLALVRREDPGQLKARIDMSHDQIRATLEDYQASLPTTHSSNQTTAKALTALDNWQTTQMQVVNLQSQGRYREAVDLAAGSGINDVPAKFAELDSALQQSVATAQSEFQETVRSARQVSYVVTQILIFLGFLAGAGVFFGLRPRIQEYR